MIMYMYCMLYKFTHLHGVLILLSSFSVEFVHSNVHFNGILLVYFVQIVSF